MTGTGTRTDPYRAQFANDPSVVRHGCLRFSRQSDCLLMLDAPQTYLNTVAGSAGVQLVATPANIDNALTAGQATTIRNALEARQIPAAWVVAGLTRREVIRTVAHMAFLNQRLEGIFLRPFHSRIETWLQNGGMVGIRGVTAPPANAEELKQHGKLLLGTTYGELPANVQQFLLDVRDRQGWTNQDLGLTAQSTVREILRAMGAQGVGWQRRLARHGLTLDSTWTQLPAAFQDELREVVEDFGFDPQALGLSGASTLRQILRTFADQFQNEPIEIGGVTV